MSKTLVVFYSRSGVTKKVALEISRNLNCEIEEIIDKKKRSGVFGFIRSGFEAIKKKLPEIAQIAKNPENYDLLILGTPVWASNISSPLRTYIVNYKGRFKNVSFFSTQSSSRETKVFAEFEEMCEKKPISILKLREKDVKRNEYAKKIEEYCAVISKKSLSSE